MCVCVRVLCHVVYSISNILTCIDKCVYTIVERTVLRLLETKHDHDEENVVREQLFYLKNDLLFLETKIHQKHVHLMNCIKYKPIYVEHDVHAAVLSTMDGCTFRLQDVVVYDNNDDTVDVEKSVTGPNIVLVFRFAVQIKRIEFVQLKRHGTVFVTLYRCASMVPSTIILETEIVSLNDHVLCNTAVM